MLRTFFVILGCIGAGFEAEDQATVRLGQKSVADCFSSNSGSFLNSGTGATLV